MFRRKMLNVLLATSVAAFAVTAAAQTSGQNNTPRNAPTGTPAPAVGTSPSSMGTPATSGLSAPSTGVTTNTGMAGDMPKDMSGYKAARAACVSGPAANQDQCRTTLNTRYSSIDPKCQKLLGSALDECLKGADRGQ
jgi:hypothetical protein